MEFIICRHKPSIESGCFMAIQASYGLGMPHEVLVEKLYTEIAIGCQVRGCGEVFLAKRSASDPVELWALHAASEAERNGWRVTAWNAIVCPAHGLDE